MSDQFIYDNYFETIEPIWRSFFAEKISLKQRDEMLAGFRAILFREQQRRKEKPISHKLPWRPRK